MIYFVLLFTYIITITGGAGTPPPPLPPPADPLPDPPPPSYPPPPYSVLSPPSTPACTVSLNTSNTRRHQHLIMQLKGFNLGGIYTHHPDLCCTRPASRKATVSHVCKAFGHLSPSLIDLKEPGRPGYHAINQRSQGNLPISGQSLAI